LFLERAESRSFTHRWCNTHQTIILICHITKPLTKYLREAWFNGLRCFYYAYTWIKFFRNA
jgi:hypothetical protein